MSVTVERLYELAKQLSPQERQRLAKMLLANGEPQACYKSEAAQGEVRDPLADDPWFAELREAMQRAMDELGFTTVEEIMSWLRGRPWGFDDESD